MFKLNSLKPSRDLGEASLKMRSHSVHNLLKSSALEKPWSKFFLVFEGDFFLGGGGQIDRDPIYFNYKDDY